MDFIELKKKQEAAVRAWGAAERDTETMEYCKKKGVLKHLPKPSFPLSPFTTEADWRAHSQLAVQKRAEEEIYNAKMRLEREDRFKKRQG